MAHKIKKLACAIVSTAMIAGMCSGSFAFAQGELDISDLTEKEKIETLSGSPIDNSVISTNNYKKTDYNNPISSEVFCADPTSIEYNGRLYVFGTNDHQQYEEKGPDMDNTYEKIKSLVVFSTDDMVNWVYHGVINVGEIAPWIVNSWAPTITSRVEADGLTHFYMYFSNNGTGVGVITATDPLGPWSDPLGEPLISTDTEGLKDCPNPFDPGVVIDENGDGWLSFGAGKAANGTNYMPGSARIVKLGEDMLSFDSDFTEIPAPYLFEASELNYINGTYVYTYNSDWSDHTAKWDYDCDAPSQCSMVYMTSKTPLDPDSWEMKGECFKNPGTSGFDYSNNHTHLQKYKDNYYMLYHTLMLKSGMGISGGYRSLCVDEINVDEDSVTIEKAGGTKKGVTSAANKNPYIAHIGAELNNTADITFDTSDMTAPLAISDKAGSWTSVKNVEFTASQQTDDKGETTQSSEPVLTAVKTIKYNFTVTGVDKDTTLSFYSSGKDGVECEGRTNVTDKGDYTVTCTLDNAEQIQNLGYFRASYDAQITFNVNSIVINDKYEFDISTELTNTREWADGLKNIWNGFSDGDEVYSADNAVLKYVKADEAIEMFVVSEAGGKVESTAPDTEKPLVFLAQVKGTGRIEARLDSENGDLLTSIDFNSPDEFTTVYNKEVAAIGGTHDIYFVYSDNNIVMKDWQFSDTDSYNNTASSSLSSNPEQSSSLVQSTSSNNSSTSSAANNANNATTTNTTTTAMPDTGAGEDIILAAIAAAAALVITMKKR